MMPQPCSTGGFDDGTQSGGAPVSALFIDHAPALGGAEHSLLMLLARLDRARWQPHLACGGGPLARGAASLNIPVHLVTLPRLLGSIRAAPDLLLGVRALRRIVRGVNAGLIVANTVRAAVYAAPAALLERTPLIAYRRELWLGGTRPRHAWSVRADWAGKALLCAAAVRVVANSQATAGTHPCPRKTAVVHNGVEPDRFARLAGPDSFPRRHQVPADVPVVGTVGRLCPIKGQDRFLRIFARIMEGLPGAWGIVAGGAIFDENSYQRDLFRLAAELGIARRIIFAGHLDDPVPALTAMDVFVQPGDPEGFGLVNLEAMAVGRPVVGYAHGALPEIVLHGQTGILVPPGDEAAMAAAILGLLRDPALRSRYGAAGQERVATHFSMQRVADQVSRIFQEAL